MPVSQSIDPDRPMCSACGVRPCRKRYGHKNPEARPGRIYKPKCARCYGMFGEQVSQEGKRKRRSIRARIIAHYGAKCECCGEARVEFLTLDHMNDNGAEHRRQYGSGSGFYRWVIRSGFPSELRLLCFNCNCARGHYGYCPHEKERALSGSG